MSNNSWVVIPFNECFIRRRTERAILVRLPRWVDDVIGSFWVPAGCLKYADGLSLVIPGDMKIEISYKKADPFGVFGDWQKRMYPPDIVKSRMFEVEGHHPAEGDLSYSTTAPELEPVHVEPLEELIDNDNVE